MKRAIFPILPDMSLCIHIQLLRKNFSGKSIIYNSNPTIPSKTMEFLKRSMPLSE
ncbi:hypothetical protein [Pedobacter sp. B4-66]|uniref:hypothetical protein n=1 Tax=Pedobacter sp. B4-66 TaxID=2817280 RepID=UPI001BD9CBC2|nr:hypothetical protein [Pedobacter sp. B4-66]